MQLRHARKRFRTMRYETKIVYKTPTLLIQAEARENVNDARGHVQKQKMQSTTVFVLTIRCLHPGFPKHTISVRRP